MGAAYNTVASSHEPTILDGFEAHFFEPSGRSINTKLRVLQSFDEVEPPGLLCHSLTLKTISATKHFTRGKYAVFGIGVLDSSYKDLAIQAPDLQLIFTIPYLSPYFAERGFSALQLESKRWKRVDILMRHLMV